MHPPFDSFGKGASVDFVRSKKLERDALPPTFSGFAQTRVQNLINGYVKFLHPEWPTNRPYTFDFYKRFRIRCTYTDPVTGPQFREIIHEFPRIGLNEVRGFQGGFTDEKAANFGEATANNSLVVTETTTETKSADFGAGLNTLRQRGVTTIMSADLRRTNNLWQRDGTPIEDAFYAQTDETVEGAPTNILSLMDGFWSVCGLIPDPPNPLPAQNTTQDDVVNNDLATFTEGARVSANAGGDAAASEERFLTLANTEQVMPRQILVLTHLIFKYRVESGGDSTVARIKSFFGGNFATGFSSAETVQRMVIRGYAVLRPYVISSDMHPSMIDPSFGFGGGSTPHREMRMIPPGPAVTIEGNRIE